MASALPTPNFQDNLDEHRQQPAAVNTHAAAVLAQFGSDSFAMPSTWLDNFGLEMGEAAWMSKFEEETLKYFHKPDRMAENWPPFREDQVDWLWGAVSQKILLFARKVNNRFVEAEQRLGFAEKKDRRGCEGH